MQRDNRLAVRSAVTRIISRDTAETRIAENAVPRTEQHQPESDSVMKREAARTITRESRARNKERKQRAAQQGIEET
jgi:hypothetical protein